MRQNYDSPLIVDSLLGPHRSVHESEVIHQIGEHQVWLETGGKEGKQINFFYSETPKTRFSKMNLSQGQFECADLRHASFQGSNLTGANFYGAVSEPPDSCRCHTGSI